MGGCIDTVWELYTCSASWWESDTSEHYTGTLLRADQRLGTQDTQCTWGTSHPVASPDTPNIWCMLLIAPTYRCILFTRPAWCINCLLQASNRAMPGGGLQLIQNSGYPSRLQVRRIHGLP